MFAASARGSRRGREAALLALTLLSSQLLLGSQLLLSSEAQAAESGAELRAPAAASKPAEWLAVARAREQQGQLVEAFEAYDRLLERLPEQGLSAEEQRVQRLATTESEVLARRLCWLTVVVDDLEEEGQRVWIDQRALPSARVRSPYPVNPGWHTVLVERYGEAHAARLVYVEEGDRRGVDLRAATPNAVLLSSSASRRLALSPVASGQVVDRSGWSEPTRVAGYVSLGLGALAGLVGVAALPGASEDRTVMRQIQTRTATVGLTAGGLGLLTGGLLLLLAPEQSRAQAGLALDVSPAREGASVNLGGVF